MSYDTVKESTLEFVKHMCARQNERDAREREREVRQREEAVKRVREISEQLKAAGAALSK